ncbi:hypothetical protein DSM14862_04061 (plasmid) [Sulfitobacter indolifex]|nr:hypothetical protein DSM14862_04061 [Sulfitobacter indolifex]
MKLNYSKPSVRARGKDETITKAGQGGLTLDASFPAGTPFKELTTP